MARTSEKKNQPNNDRAHIWCTNCKGHGHILPNCPSPPNLPPKCRFCGSKHQTESCKNMQTSLVMHANNQNQSSEVYQVESNSNNFQSNTPNWGSNQNWGNNYNIPKRRNFNHNQNYNSNQNFNQPTYNFSPNFSPNNFNNGGYNNNPNRPNPQMPSVNNQGSSQLPFGNVNY